MCGLFRRCGQANADGIEDGLVAVLETQLIENVLQVRAHRAAADLQFLGYLLICSAAADQAQDLRSRSLSWSDWPPVWRLRWATNFATMRGEMEVLPRATSRTALSRALRSLSFTR